MYSMFDRTAQDPLFCKHGHKLRTNFTFIRATFVPQF